MDWSSAQSYCRVNFVDLAHVENDTENLKIQNLVPSGESAWIGINGHVLIYWSDNKGRVITFSDIVLNPVDSETCLWSYASAELQDRLEENGVSGVSLKWREQPDGKVFYKEGEKSSKEEQKKTEL
ncbi:neurocan core protein-like protein [Lates japonicus]|uniref:Neurocan core protein-like protein n=1 Tax=Lates japonicus TaxID=270547 RepID=A0AAD3RF55_LATJO|nr:neurocan core protein-like protein [Lates japonicus]